MKFLSPILVAVVSQIIATSSVFSAVVVIVDVTDPSNVTFTSTAAFSQINEVRTQGDGVTFIDLFVTSPGNNTSFSGSLTPAGSAGAFSTNFVNPPNDFNLFGPGGHTMTYSIAAAAFTGQGFDDLSFATLASPGTVSDIRTGFNDGNFGGVVGQNSVIPEPTATILIGLGGLALMLRRRR